MLRVFLIRHNISRGMENYEERARFSDKEMPLSDTGFKDSEHMARWLKDYLNAHPNGPVTIISSDFKRAWQDADGLKTMLSPRKVHASYTDRLREIDKGKFWGLTRTARINAYGDKAKEFYRRRNESGEYYETPFLGGESPKDVYEKRIEPFVRECRQNFHDGDLVIVSHDIPLRFIAGKLLRKDPRQVEQEKPSGCGGIRLFEGEGWASLKDREYIYEGKIPPQRPDHPEDPRPPAYARQGKRGR